MSGLSRSELIERLKSVWCAILQVQAVDVNENFFELGGNSLQVLQVKERLDDELGYAVELIRFFQYPTVIELAAYLQRSGR
jgi:acyl carrier protein